MMDNSNFNRVQAVINLDNIRDNITAMKRLIDGHKGRRLWTRRCRGGRGT